MRHLTVESKDLLIGDEVADLLTRYAALLADQGGGDRVELRAFSDDGDEVSVTIVLSSGTTIVAESSHNRLPEPDNADAVAYLSDRIALMTDPPQARFASQEDREPLGGLDEL
jgi:hypothetical protein